MSRIGIIGLGRMGTALARRFADQGHPITTWTRSERSLDGIDPAKSLDALANQCDSLVLSLLNDEAVSEVLDTLLTCDLSGKQIIDTSTVIPQTLQSRAVAISAAGASCVDAPISGGPEMVLAGTCGIFLGLGHPLASEVSAGAGFDWLLIDGEHAAVQRAVECAENSVPHVWFALSDFPGGEEVGFSAHGVLHQRPRPAGFEVLFTLDQKEMPEALEEPINA